MDESESKWVSVGKDPLLCLALAVTLAVYLGLVFIHPTGENWGRGWNMVAFLIYSAPISLCASALAFWRRGRNVAFAKRAAGAVGVAALIFPIVCIVGIMAKA